MNQNEKTKIIFLDGKKMLDVSSALNEIYIKLNLENYLGYENYDGLDELLSYDLWPEIDKLQIIINNSKDFLNSKDVKNKRFLKNLLKEKALEWDKHKGKNAFEFKYK